MDELTILARGGGPLGETVLRRRASGTAVVHELIVNGIFAMDSRETASERELAGHVVPGDVGPVLVAGLGLGYTAAAVLDRLAAEGRVDLVELDPHLVSWARSGATPQLARVAGDPRTRLHVADVADVLSGSSGPTGPWSAILVDVDNGPDFLIHDANAALYGEPLLAAAVGGLVPGGVLAVWCQGPAPSLRRTLDGLDADVAEHRHEVRRESRQLSYVVYTAVRRSR